MMLAIIITSFLFIMCSSCFGAPISGTHTVIGAYMGAGIAATHRASSVNWLQLAKIGASWLISPALSAILAFLLMIYVAALVLDTKTKSFATRFHSIQLISATCCSIAAGIVYKLSRSSRDGEDRDRTGLVLLISFPLGVILVRFIILTSLKFGSVNRKSS